MPASPKTNSSVGAKKKALKKSVLRAPTINDYLKSLDYDADKSAPLDVLAFYLGADLYAVDVAYVEEVTRLSEIAELPRMPDFIEGIMSLRGVMIPIMDLKKRLAIKAERENYGRVVVVSNGDHFIGLGVDRMSGMMTALKDFKSVGGKKKDPFVTGVGTAGNDTVKVLDVEGLMDLEVDPLTSGVA